MTEPYPPIGDPTSVILARMEVKLDNALAEQSRHSTIIDRHDRILDEHGNRLTVLETRSQAEDGHRAVRINDRVAFWTTISALAIVAGLVVTIILSGHA